MKTIVENINKVIKNKKYEDDFKVGSFIFHKLKFNDGFEVFLNDVYDAKKEPELVINEFRENDVNNKQDISKTKRRKTAGEKNKTA